MRRLLDVLQASGTTPVRNRAHIHIEQLGRGLRRIASIPALPSATGPGGLGTARENGIGRADPRDFCRREGPSQAWSGACLVQESRYLAVRMMRGKAPDPGNNGGRGAAAITGPRRAGKVQQGARFGLPTNRHRDGRGAFGQRHVFDQTAQQLLALGVRGGRRRPHRRDILRQRHDTLAFLRAHQPCGQWRQRRLFSLQGGQRRQLLVPVPLQRACDEAVLRVARQEASAGEISLILGALQPEVPLAFALPRLGLHLLQSGQRDRQLGGLHGVEEDPCDGGIHPIAAERLTGGTSLAHLEGLPVVAGDRPVLQVTHAHAPPALATQDQSLQ